MKNLKYLLNSGYDEFLNYEDFSYGEEETEVNFGKKVKRSRKLRQFKSEDQVRRKNSDQAKRLARKEKINLKSNF